MKRVKPVLVAGWVGAGVVLTAYLQEPRPISYLIRPLVASTILAVVIGLASGFLGRAATAAAAFTMVGVLRPDSPAMIGLAVMLAVVILPKVWGGSVLELSNAFVAGALVFALVAAVPVVSLRAPSSPTGAPESSTPTFILLLDGYPRADTLSKLGVDISTFVEELQNREFDHYPGATSHHTRTYRTLTLMTTGTPMASDDWGTADERRAARETWDLPAGFVTIAPPFGSVTFPNVPVLNPGGPNDFEETLIGQSVFSAVGSNYVLDGLRYQLNRSIDLLATTDEERVFVHLLAPHTPFLYNGEAPAPALPCWPGCSAFDIDADRLGLGIQGWRDGISGYLAWLNPRLIDVVDSLISRHPDAEIVLFSDHGGRFDESDRSEWRRVFFAARTPMRRWLFADSPHPGAVLTTLFSDPSAMSDRQPLY